MASTDVKYVKKALSRRLALYKFIRACMQGPLAIYSGAEEWLPHPDPLTKDTAEGKARYESYLSRARFYNLTGNTISGMHGQIFAREPVITIPDGLKILEEDASGSGVSLAQQARDVTMDVVGLGRHALLADYSNAEDRELSILDVENGVVRPFIMNYAPEDVINWRVSLVNGRRRLTLLVLRERSDVDAVDTFEEDVEELYRELRLIDGVYHQRIWKSTEEGGDPQAGEWVIPTKADGSHFDEIPAVIIGAENNDPEIDDCPMADIADLNMGHYINSADYEEAVFLVGQPTPVITGVTAEWIKNVFKDNTIYLGSREAVKLPKDANMFLLQAQPNNMAMEAMTHKEKQMVALGARLVQERSVQRTAAEYSGDRATQTSVLATISRNVSDGYLKIFGWLGEYSGIEVTDNTLEFELNTDFDLSKMTPEEVRAVIESWQQRAISFTEMRFALKKGGAAFQKDEEAREEIDSQPQSEGLDIFGNSDEVE